MQPSVSIILPTYNHGIYLRKTIDKILNIDYDEIELLIVDDGSEDSTGQILTEINDPRVKVFRNENHGVSFSRNMGLDLAKGEYIWFVDDDDDFIDTLIKQSIDKIKENQADLVMFGVSEVDEKGRILRKRLFEGESSSRRVKNEELVVSDFSRLAVSKVFSKQIIGDVRFREDQSFGEDYTFFLEILAKKPTINIINKVLYSYVVTHTTSASKRFDIDRIETIKFQKAKIREILKNEQVDLKTTKKILLKFNSNAQNNSIGNLFNTQNNLTFYKKIKELKKIKKEFQVSLMEVIKSSEKKAVILKAIILKLPSFISVIFFEVMYALFNVRRR
ncbi:glycosyltransferase family 2 protein [Pediococcus pentosaceus]|uniref:glycosyltransferase family 2 protein n=1 Tax=Pediococcus pentosaceus TaxID=1255 RepID=UPI000C085282|nr:glycosyltransferase family 2 protein [Pediococcus pentosaceus]MCS8563943.1 glycosyltransferase family 2 protein [Pediococcus pentosaceus]MCS8568238.1 glycosyltransferase family 2 protein [Pediococcus pentosaceus]MCS8580880.1 glycosyltransferase family 2 protein [Pediococcus pentosaceus]